MASLLGSTHCAGMCGAFVAIAVGTETERPTARWLLHAAYNGGRLVTYLVMGIIAGTLGGAFELGANAVGMQRGAAAAAGALMILFGVSQLLRVQGVRVPKMQAPGAMRRLATAAHRRAFQLPPVPRAGVIGLLTTLLPCGWLYAFVIAAAGTAHPLWGAVAMAAFWVGTLPVLVLVGVGVRAITGPLGRHLPVLVPLLLVAVGLGALLGRIDLPTMEAGARPVGVEAAIDHVRSVDHTDLPCCGGNP